MVTEDRDNWQAEQRLRDVEHRKKIQLALDFLTSRHPTLPWLAEDQTSTDAPFSDFIPWSEFIEYCASLLPAGHRDPNWIAWRISAWREYASDKTNVFISKGIIPKLRDMIDDFESDRISRQGEFSDIILRARAKQAYPFFTDYASDPDEELETAIICGVVHGLYSMVIVGIAYRDLMTNYDIGDLPLVERDNNVFYYSKCGTDNDVMMIISPAKSENISENRRLYIFEYR
jgi:hypothetical protein